jgi:hypothetical protein
VSDFSVAVLTVTTSGSNGTENFTRAGFGTPKGAIVIGGISRPGTNPADDGHFSIGFTDGTTSKCSIISDINGVGSTITARYYGDYAYGVYITSSGLYNEATAAFINDGIALTFSNAAVSRQLTIILFGGVDCQCKVGQAVEANGTVSVTGVGFTPDCVFSHCMGYTTGGTICIVSLGASTPSLDRCIGFRDDNAIPYSGPNVVLSDVACGQKRVGSGAPWDWYGSTSNYNADGFDYSIVSGSTSDLIAYLAISTGGAAIAVGTYTSPTSVGTHSVSGLGFQPQAVLIGMTKAANINVNELDTDAEGFSVGAFDGTNEQCIDIYIQDEADITVTKSSYTATALYRGQVGSPDLSAGFDSMDAGGFTLNYTTAPAAARLGFYVAFEEGSSRVFNNYHIFRSKLFTSSFIR